MPFYPFRDLHKKIPLPGKSRFQENPIPRIEVLVNHREEEAHRDIPKGANHAAHSSWEKLRRLLWVSAGRCSSRKFIIAAGAGLRVRMQESQLARKNLGGWKRESFFSGLCDIKTRS